MPAFCTVDGCDRPHKSRGYCATHYAQFRRGNAITEVIAVRQPTDGLTCSANGCEKPVKSLGYCKMHYMRFKRHGDPEQERKQRARCMIAGCDSPAIAKGLCNKHYYREWRTGTTADPVVRYEVFETCHASGCTNIVVGRGLCAKHYKRWSRHQHVLDTRPADWGAREKHHLYPVWNAIMRYHRQDCCERWHDLWKFVEDVAASQPSLSHKLVRKDGGQPYGPDNFYWREPKTVRSNPERAAYMRKWNAANPEKLVSKELKKRYGITVTDYQRMFDLQDGKCAICGNAETRVDHRTKKVSRLAVDHCHKTGQVRKLLCHSCNSSIGAASDDPDRLRAAAEYLERHSAPDSIDQILDGAPPSGPPH